MVGFTLLVVGPAAARADTVLVFGRYDSVAVLTSMSADYARGVLTELGDTVTYIYGFGATVPTASPAPKTTNAFPMAKRSGCSGSRASVRSRCAAF